MMPEAQPTTSSAVEVVREAARRQARALSGGLMVVLGGVVAVGAMALFMVLDYRFDQAPHRLVKIMLGATAIALIILKPSFGLFLIPIAAPFMSLMPLLPIPGVNTLNALLFSVFFTWALARVINREPLFGPDRLGGWIGALLLVVMLSIVRGAAYPAGFKYEPGPAGLDLFRAAVSFSPYFICMAMTQGERGRRNMVWAVMLGLAVEAVTTMVLGQNGRGGRAAGSIGQPNQLGTFLALYTALTAAMVTGVRGWFPRLMLLASVAGGAFGIFLSVSRGAIVALVVAMLFVAFRSSRLLTVVVLVALATSPLYTPENVKLRMTSTHEEVEGSDETVLEGSAQARIDTWQTIIKIAKDHPIDGVGFGGLGYLLRETGGALGYSEAVDSAHNTFMRMLGEMGIFGLAVFVGLLWTCWRLSADGIRLARNRLDRQLAVGLGGATLALAVSCWFGDRFWAFDVMASYWILCALVNNMVFECRAEKA